MKTAVTYPGVRAVRPLSGKKLLVTFSTGEVRCYDCRPLLSQEPFRALEDAGLFLRVHADPRGYGVIWNDEIDLAESELWINGTPAEPEHGADRSQPLRSP